MDVENSTGNGFLYQVYDSGGLLWAIEQAMAFYHLPQASKNRQIERVMVQSKEAFSHAVTARHYIDLYEKMLERPLVRSFSP